MAELEDNPEAEDPFSDKNLRIQQFILSARLYDVMLALLKVNDSGAANDILELHSQGHILGSAPGFSGVFLTDEMNADEPDGLTDEMNADESASPNANADEALEEDTTEQ